MLYHLHEIQHAALTPVRLMAEAMQQVYSHPWVPLSYTKFGRTIAAGAELVERTTRRYKKPEFNLPFTQIGEELVRVREEVVYELPFCTLTHFEREGTEHRNDPKVLVCAPLSGHYATLLRGTVETLLPDHEVYITDWIDARDVSLAHGNFDLDDYINYMIEFFSVLGPNTHVLAVCQPGVPVIAAISIMAAENHPDQPASVVLMGSPIDTRISATKVNEVATNKPYSWFEKTVIHSVPYAYAGRGRRVYPGFLQLQGFMSMNLERHVGEHLKLFHNMVRGDGDSAEQHRVFYDEYLSVMDLPADYYLQTIRKVFQEHQLPKYEMVSRGRIVDPRKIERTALFAIEGEKDDITGIGQTKAVLDLCSGLPSHMKKYHLQAKVGHYGVFNGRRWREEIYPHVREFYRTFDRPAVLEGQAADGADKGRVGKPVRRVREVLPA